MGPLQLGFVPQGDHLPGPPLLRRQRERAHPLHVAAPLAAQSDSKKPDPSEALHQVTRRFLAAYAPLTTADLARWLGPAVRVRDGARA